MSEVATVAGRCVIWRCPRPAEERACAAHAGGLALEPPPCRHGVTGRCKRCWESSPAGLEERRAAYHARKQRKQATSTQGGGARG